MKLPAIVDQVVRSPHMSIATGLILIVSALFESTETLLESIMGIEIQSYHGLIIFGIVQILKSITDMLDGMERLENDETQ